MNKEQEDVNNVYSETSIDIYAETFDKDFDDVAWNPKTSDDSDENAAELYGLNN